MGAVTNEASRAAAWALVVACARHAASTGDLATVHAAADAVTDWDDALALVRRHRLSPWLVRALSHPGAPRDPRARAELESAADAANALAKVRQLTRLCSALARAGVPALPYKGPLLSLQLYGDLALRNSIDLDLVVPRASYRRARDVMLAEGFPPRGGHTLRQERALFGWLGHASFGVRDDDFVELHWRFAPRPFPFALQPADAMRRGTVVTVAGVQLTQMADDDLLVTLAMHGARHLYEQLEWLAGCVRLLQRIDASADVLLAHASRLHARRMLLTSVAVAQRLLQFTPSPQWQAALARDPDSAAVADVIAQAVRDEALHHRPLPVNAPLQALYSRMLEWEWVRLPDALSPLYRLIRLLRLAVVYARRASRRGRA